MAAPTFVGAGTGVVSAAGGLTLSPDGVAVQIGDLVVLQVLQDGTGSGLAIGSVVGLRNIADTVNDMTQLTSFPAPVGSPTAARQFLWLARATATTTSVTVAHGTDDHFLRVYVFRGVKTGTAILDIFENGAWADGISSAAPNGAGSTAAVADTAVVTLGADRLALQFVAVDDDNPVGPFTGMTGGTWAEAVAEFASATGTDGCIQLQTATMASAGTINGGSFTMAAPDNWGVIGLALIPVPSGPTIHSKQAALAATGLILVVGRETLARLAALNATGAVVASGVRVAAGTTLERSVVVAATGQITAAGISVVKASAAVTASAGIASAGQERLSRSVAFTAVAGIASAGREQLARLAEVAAATNISVAGQVESGTTIVERSAAVSAAAAIATVGRELLSRSAAVSATATATAIGRVVAHRSAALTAAATVSAAGEIEGATVRAAQVAATGTVSAAGTVIHVRAGAAALTATGAVTTAPQRALGRAAGVAVTPTLAARPQRALARTAGLDTLAAITTVTGNVGQASFTAIGTITLSRFLEPGYLTSTRAGRIAIIYHGQIPVSGLGGIEYPGADEGELAAATVGGIARTGG